jgi:hypothetical protein
MKRQPKKLSSTLERRVSGYALAAGAVGVGALAVAHPAEAKIVYTPTHHVLKKGDKVVIEFAGQSAFTLEVTPCSQIGSCYGNFLSQGMISGSGGSNNLVSFKSCCTTWGIPFVPDLKQGARIPPKTGGSSFAAHGVLEQRMSNGQYRLNWLPGTKDRYEGFKFSLGGKYHYGWARMSIRGPHNPPGITVVLTGYAYETIPNKPIIAGKTKGPDVVTVQDATLGHLAAGASAIPVWRQEQ